MSIDKTNIVRLFYFLMRSHKIGLFSLIVLLLASNTIDAQNSENSGLLNDQIDMLMNKVESAGELNDSEIERLGLLHYQRGLTYKALYLFSIDASLMALENLENNYGISTESHFYDLLHIRKYHFLNNRSSAEAISENHDDHEQYLHWQFSADLTPDFTEKSHIVANWYRNPERDMVCSAISDRDLNEFCNVFNHTISDFDEYLQGERMIRDFMPVSRDELIDYSHTELISFVDNFHAHWIYDFSVSFWLLDSIDSTQRILPLFESRKWNKVTRFRDSSNNVRSRIIYEIAEILVADQAAMSLDPFVDLLSFDAHDNQARWIFTVNSLLEGVNMEALKEYLVQSDYRRIINQRNSRQAIQIAEILIRAQKTISARDILSRYLPQSGSYNLRTYGAQRLALSAHFNFASSGIGGENVAKTQLSEFQHQFPTIMPLYFLVQLATEREPGNPNDLIQTN